MLLALIAVGIGVGLVMAVAVRQRRKLARMSDAELRSFLEGKLAGRVTDEQIGVIHDAVLTKLGRSPSTAPEPATE